MFDIHCKGGTRVKKTAALLLVIGLVCAPAAYAQQTTADVPAAPAPAGSASSETVPAGPAKAAPAPAEADQTQSEAEQAEPAQAEPAQSEPEQAEPAQAEPQSEPEQVEPAQAEPAQSEPEQAEPAQAEPARSPASATVTGAEGSSPAQAEVQHVEGREDFVTLNFSNIDISALVKVMSELLHRNFLLDERVRGKVTIMTPMRISPQEAYQVFLSALEIKGFTAIEDGQVTRVIPAAAARQSALRVLKDGGELHGEGFVTKLIRLRFVSPEDVVHTIAQLVSKNGSLIAYAPTNSLIITDSVPNIRKIENLVRIMDVAAPEGEGRINVYYLKNGNAEDMSKLLQGLVSRLPKPPAGGKRSSSPTTILEGSVIINADKATNALIIIASAKDFEIIKDVIQKLDIRRRQVYVEAAIIEMSLAKQRELGFEFQAANLGDIESSNSVAGIGGTNFGNIGSAVANGPAGLAAMSGLNVGAVKGTFTFKGVEYLNIGALLHALQTDADVNVLSTPNILTTDNEKAEIMVGENVPFITGQTQNAATGTGAILNSIDRKDVGIKLQITPQITSDDNVRLQIKQEISDVIQTSGSTQSNLGPTTSKRSADTTVVIKDRQTMVIGGLIRDNLTSTTSKVPLLGDIPILGWFFKYRTTKMEKTNLMIFITPYIIKDGSEAESLTKRKSDALDEFRKEYRMKRKKEEKFHLPVSTSAPAPAVETPSKQEGAASKTTPAPAAPAPKADDGKTPAEGAR
jgi:general secretion pathway protein D